MHTEENAKEIKWKTQQQQQLIINRMWMEMEMFLLLHLYNYLCLVCKHEVLQVF